MGICQKWLILPLVIDKVAALVEEFIRFSQKRTLFRRIAMPKERNKADSYREKVYAGDIKAMNNLGICYERGTGVKVNLKIAFNWY